MRKRLVTAALVVFVGALAVVLSSSTTAATSDSPNNPKTDIQSGNFFCGFDFPALPVIGFTNYHRQGNTVSVNYHLKNGIPNATYRVELWGDLCTFFGVVTTVTTNKNGVANGNGSVTVPAASTRFFAAGLGPNGYNDAVAVELLP
jgi:hypothetical protein